MININELSRKQSIIFSLFLIFAIIKNIIGVGYIDIILVVIFFISTIFFRLPFYKKIIMVFLFSLLCTMRTSILGINIRGDDFVTIFMVIYLVYSWFSKKLNIKRIDKLIIIYILYSAIILIVNSIFRNNQVMYFLILFKEIQYFIYFIFFRNVIKIEKDYRFVLQILFLCSIANIVWGIYQVVNSNVSFYGIGCLASGASAHSGGVFFAILILMIYLFNKNKKIIYFVFMIISVVLTLFVVSRTFIIALCIAIFIYFCYTIFLIFKKKKVKKKLVFMILLILSVGVVFSINSVNFDENIYMNKIIFRFSHFDSAKDTRVNKWIRYLSSSEPVGIIFGNGKGFPQMINNVGFKLGTDSQYVCLILETGIVGMLLWFAIIGEISLNLLLKKRLSLEIIMINILVITYLIMGITMEIFQTVLQASLFWCFTGIFIAKNDLKLLETRE